MIRRFAIILLLSLAAARAAEIVVTEPPKPARPNIPAREFSLTNFGAVGDGQTLNTEAFQRAIAAVAAAGGGRLTVPAGTYVTAPFTLCSNLDFHLADGAIIQAPTTFAGHGLPEPTRFKTQTEANAAVKMPPPLISAKNVHDLALTGPGIIDGAGQHWWEWSERAARAVAKTQPGRVVYPRPHLVVIENCQRLLVADLTLRNSSKFHLVPKRVDDLTIERVKVRAPFNAPNTDAIDPGPGNRFWIHDCDIDTGDDDIVIKSGGTEILIENNTLRHGHGISIGSETTAGVRNMLVRNCTLDGPDNGIRIKSMRGAGGLVENIRYTNITMKGVANPIVLQLDYVDNNRPDFKGDPSKVPTIRNIQLDRITIEGARNSAVIHGIPDSRITHVVLRDVTIVAEKDFDLRDADEPHRERVSVTIKPGVGPAKIAGEH